MTTALRCWVAVATVVALGRARLADERGEGVISTAIAVLIIALIGALLWGAFNGIFDTVSTKTSDAVEQIG